MIRKALELRRLEGPTTGTRARVYGISVARRGIEQHEREERQAPAPNSQPQSSAPVDDDIPF